MMMVAAGMPWGGAFGAIEESLMAPLMAVREALAKRWLGWGWSKSVGALYTREKVNARETVYLAEMLDSKRFGTGGA